MLLPQLVKAQGQQGSGSPYSAYGFGEFVGSTPVAQALSGGLGTAVIDPVSTVLANPASYPTLLRPTFETGISVRSSSLASATMERTGRRTDILGLTLGVPFGNGRWGMALGIRPVSKVNYQLTETRSIPNAEGAATFTYAGDGGLNQAVLGAGFVISQKRDTLANGHRFSVGANFAYLFGRIESSSAAVFPSGQGLYSTRISSTLILRDPTGNVGIQYQGDIRKRRTKADKGWFYLAGLAAELPVELKARRSDAAYSFGYSAAGVEIPLDTSNFVGSDVGRIGLPIGLSAGFTVFNEKWTIGVEYRQRDWTALTVSDPRYQPSGQLANNTTVILGATYRPSQDVMGPLWNRMVYRAGVRLNNDYLKIGGTQLEDRCATIGVSLPLMATTTRSRLNIGGEFGERGTMENGLLRERYATLIVGFTITPDLREGWFKKRRID